MKKSIYDGWVVSIEKAGDMHNPNDKILDIFCYLNLSSIDSKLKGIAKLRVYCRLSVSTKTLTIKTMQKNFRVDNA